MRFRESKVTEAHSRKNSVEAVLVFWPSGPALRYASVM
jgi:hypothetical protein